MNKRYEHYSIEIHWSELDEVFIVTVPELPGESQCLNQGFYTQMQHREWLTKS